MTPLIEKFSDKYYVLDAETQPYSGDKFAVPHDMFKDLMKQVEVPMLKVGSRHYMLDNQWGIPRATLAVPSQIEDEQPDSLLIPNSKAVDKIIKYDQWAEEVEV